MPGKEATLEGGSWQVKFGEGLDFEIRILPWTAREKHHDWVLISPPPETSSLPTKRSDNAGATEPRADSRKMTGEDREIARAPPPNILVSKTRETLVFKTTQKGTIVAIKVCRTSTVRDSADTWRKEKEILSTLDHPSIIKLLNYDALNVHLELEYGGRDLSKFIDRKRMLNLSEEIAYQIWRDISSGIEYIHSKEILHLDIKAENILLCEDYRAKICDFGVSIQNAVEPVPFNGGTPTYTPPEFLRTGKRGRPADIWGFGLVMMFSLGIWPLPPVGNWVIADIRPQKGDAATKMLDWFAKVKRSTERIPDRYSLLTKMLIIDPSQRITSSDLVKNLRQLPQAKALTREILL